MSLPRLFLGNFDFEHRLADPLRQLPAKLDRINAELATSWLAIANDGDYLWTPRPIDSTFFEQAARDGLPRVIPVVSLTDVPRGVECVPWGWTDSIRTLCDKQGWSYSAPPQEAVCLANSRRFSSRLEHEWQVGLDFSGEATSFQDVERLLSFHGRESRWVIKAEFGMSGRERIIGCGSPTVADRNWIGKRIASDGAVFFEPWVTRQSEDGIQIEVPRKGEPTLIGIAPMVVDERGQYAGSVVRFETKVSDNVVEVTLRAAVLLQERGYFGPLGIDVMTYQTSSGDTRNRPLQDINARWTMGRLSLGLRRLLQPNESGFWQHGTGEWSEVTSTVIRTSPSRVNGVDARHHSQLLISSTRSGGEPI